MLVGAPAGGWLIGHRSNERAKGYGGGSGHCERIRQWRRGLAAGSGGGDACGRRATMAALVCLAFFLFFPSMAAST